MFPVREQGPVGDHGQSALRPLGGLEQHVQMRVHQGFAPGHIQRPGKGQDVAELLDGLRRQVNLLAPPLGAHDAFVVATAGHGHGDVLGERIHLADTGRGIELVGEGIELLDVLQIFHGILRTRFFARQVLPPPRPSNSYANRQEDGFLAEQPVIISIMLEVSQEGRWPDNDKSLTLLPLGQEKWGEA